MEPVAPTNISRRGPNGIVFVDCSDVDDGVFDRTYRDVLQPAFRPAELDTLDAMRTAFRTPFPGRFGTIALRSGEPVAAALAEYDAASEVLLLGYLAVRSDQRGRGTGSALLSDSLPRWRENARPVAVLAEVEDPRCYEAGPYGDPAARLRMYERVGWRLLPVPYFQPALGQGLPRVRGLLLIGHALDGAAVPGAHLVRFLDRYLAECEGPEAVRSDAEYLALRKRIESWPGEVPLWPMSRLSEVPLARHG
ncbi:hypothetical protein GCM10023196_035050 [Actinoallomurus vinaceus]|uniref:N-acetyltransferase domain-containing protein n=1 Tax=Actinoallomurus vinaceus TaxID=1080074 RepID=A0ABP8U8P3_9ACTN